MVLEMATGGSVLDFPDRVPPPGRVELVSLIVLLALAFCLRVWGLTSGLPYAVGVDEPQIMDRVVRMMKTGDFNPHFFDWPSLTIYAHLFVACLAFLGGAMRGAWNGLAQVSPSDFYVYGRLFTALVGTATVGILYCAARRWGVTTALLATALLAVAPNHARESHYVLADVPTACFTTLVLLLSLRVLERPSLGVFMAAGITVGLAASCKYNGLMAIVLPLIATCAVAGSPPVILRRVLVVFAGVGCGFLMGTPYAVLDLPKFLDDYARLAAVFAQSRGGEAGWQLYLKYLSQSLGRVGLALSALGLLLSMRTVVSGASRWRALMLVAFVVVYFKVMATSYQIYGRYTLPLLPFAALLAAVGATAVIEVLRRRVPARGQAVSVAAVVCLLLMPPTVRTIGYDRGLNRETTVDLAYRWIGGHLPPGAVIVSETYPVMLTSTRYRFTNLKPLSGRTYGEYLGSGVNYVLVSAAGYDIALASRARYENAYAAYTSVFMSAHEVASFPSSDVTPGPTLKLFEIRAVTPAAPGR
jgi:4-amino-4-deoxy-L-arabinose transferase-like glycosyltransferase